MSLCFDEAYEALQRRRISEDEYLHHALAHFGGIRHAADQQGVPRQWESMIGDPTGTAIREAALSSHASTFANIASLELLFARARADDAPAVRQILLHDLPVPLVQAVATFAAQHSCARVLRVCLALGATLHDRPSALALEYAARTPALLDLLYACDWRGVRSDARAFARQAAWALHTSAPELAWFLDRGATVSRGMLRRATHAALPLEASCVALLAGRPGAMAVFAGSGVLQDAAARGALEVVRVLLDAGCDVDEVVRVPAGGSDHAHGEDDDSSEDGDGRQKRVHMTALLAAVDRQHEETVALLLVHGARPDKPLCCVKESRGGVVYRTPLALAEARHDAHILALLRRAMDRKQSGASVSTSRL